MSTEEMDQAGQNTMFGIHAVQSGLRGRAGGPTTTSQQMQLGQFGEERVGPAIREALSNASDWLRGNNDTNGQQNLPPRVQTGRDSNRGR